MKKENNAEGEIKFVLFKDSTGKWRVSTVSVTSTSFEFRLGLPEELRGLRDEELSKAAGVEGCIFIHAAGFIGGAQTEEAVLKLARMSLDKRTKKEVYLANDTFMRIYTLLCIIKSNSKKE